MSSDYSAFARFYDELTENVDYSAIAQRYAQLARKYGKFGLAADLGCGTGGLTSALADLGAEVIGVDISVDMLSVAFSKTEGKKIQFVRQDITKLDLGGCVDLIVSSLDCLNHLTNFAQVGKVFDRSASFLESGGLLIFDMNTIKKHRKILADNCFVFETDKVFCCWQNFYEQKDESVEIQLDFFEKRSGGAYSRYSESFVERAYPIEDVKNRLKSAGFEIIGVFDGLTEKNADESCERALFCAVKK